MADEERSPQPNPGCFGDSQRKLAALMAGLVEDCRDDEQNLREMAESMRALPIPGLDPAGAEHLAKLSRTFNGGLQLLQQIAAARAIAHDEMIAAGGPDDPAAYAEYRRTTERLDALMPHFGTND